MTVCSFVCACLLAFSGAFLAAPPATDAAVSSCGNGWTWVYDQTNLDGTMKEYCWGTSSGDLGAWNNRIRSLQQVPGSGHGFIYWTGPGYSDSSLKICGNSVRMTMPAGFDRTISSYQSTSLCPS
jgi:hypothetical protein